MLLLRHWAWVGSGGILTFMYLAYIRGCYAAANFWNTWKTSCRRIDAVRWGKKEANPGIDKVVTSFQKSIKIIVSLRRKRHIANFPMEFSHKKCIHLKLEKSPYKRTENQCWMILNLHFEPRPSMRRVPSSLSFLNLCCDPCPKNCPPTSGCGWSGGRKSGPDARRSTRTSGRNGGVLSVTSDAGWLTWLVYDGICW